MANQIDRLIDSVTAEISPHYADDKLFANYCEVHKHRYRYDLRRIVERVTPGARVFDFGAFPGVVSEVLTRIRYSVVAGEFDPEEFPFAPSLTFPVLKADANASRINIDSESFDAILMMEVFEHLYRNPIVTMREVLRILKPGGVLYLTTPNGMGLRTLIKILRKRKLNDVYSQWARVEETGIAGHIREYTPREVSDFLADCGFSDIEVETCNVYKKSNPIEHHFWRTVSWPFTGMRENISCFAVKPRAPSGADQG